MRNKTSLMEKKKKVYQENRKHLVRILFNLGLFLGIIFFGGSSSLLAYASSEVNENEQAIIHYLEQGFTYNSKRYKVDQVYMSEFRAYVALDHINITVEQKKKVIDRINSNIEEGIGYGFLTPITEADKDKPEDNQKDNPKDNGSSDKNKDNLFEDPLISQVFGLDELNKGKEKKPNSKEEKKKGQVTKTIVNKEEGSLDIVNSEGVSLLSIDMPIKRTGFSLNNIYYMVGGLGLLFVGTILVAWKWRLFVHENE